MLRQLIASCIATSCFAYSAQDMTLEEKVGQVMMVCFRGEEANENAKVLVQEVHVGGFIYYTWANGLRSSAQVKSLRAGLQNKSPAITKI